VVTFFLSLAPVTPVTAPATARPECSIWEEKLLAQEDNPIRQLAFQNDLALIRHYDAQITILEAQLQKLTKATAWHDYTLLQTVPGIGEHLGLTILYEVGDIQRFPTVKDFLSYCRLVKGTVASVGKIKGLRGAKLGNAYSGSGCVLTSETT
jgi:transposase